MSENTEKTEKPGKKGARKRRARPRRRLRVAVLMHEDLVPPEDTTKLSEAEFDRIKTECDVLDALDSLGHQTRAIGVRDELAPIRNVIEDWSPHICFNLLDEFQGEAIYDQHVGRRVIGFATCTAPKLLTLVDRIGNQFSPRRLTTSAAVHPLNPICRFGFGVHVPRWIDD